MDDDAYSASDDFECGDDDYYRDLDDEEEIGCEHAEQRVTSDAEDAIYECLNASQVEELFSKSVSSVAEKTGVAPELARSVLLAHSWDMQKVLDLLSTQSSANQTLVSCGLRPPPPSSPSPSPAIIENVSKRNNRNQNKNSVRPPTVTAPPESNLPECTVCARHLDAESMPSLECGHFFCRACWRSHIETRLASGVSLRIECMQSGCSLLAPSEFALACLDRANLRAKYERFAFRDYVDSHPELRFCVGTDCPLIIRSRETQSNRVTCDFCKATFCVRCGGAYHAPTTCETIKKWLTKCADDSETANYISAHTKDCPKCHACIEKNGGCNHMQCVQCKHHFCWMCFGDWKTHGSEYYECSRYKENPQVASEVNNQKARRALKKYLHYYERFENHAKSLRFEEKLRDKLRQKIDDKVTGHDGTWIDWQYLYDAANLLTRCRYTLQYTYPFAYYLDSSAQKDLFEFQQAQLEKEVEDLAWAVERADSESRGALEAHMHRAEHKRLTLLHDFFHNERRPGPNAPSTSAA